MQPVYAYDPYNPGSSIPISMPVTPGVVPVAGAAPVLAGQPRMPAFAGIQYVLVQDPMAELNNCKCVIIRQQPELFEMITGCETANRYHVFGIDNNNAYKYLFKCNERSGFCQRNCCPSNMREFNMDIYQPSTVALPTNVSSFAKAFKPFRCPCFCLNRPEINVSVGAENIYIGKIKHLFSCCDPEFEIYNSQGLKYYVRADCCQCGLLCSNNICGKLSTAQFDIYQAGAGNIIANITKMTAQNYAEAVTDADSYQVGFPQGATAEDKLLLIALGLMIDYQYFETDSSDENRRRTGHRRGYGYY